MTDLPKLVRDRIPEIIREDGSTPITREVHDTEEHLDLLAQKLVEESREFAEDRQKDELTDVLEVLRCFFEAAEIEREKIEELRSDKDTQVGRFTEGVVLEDVE
jgi:predicted house-cleaning noncanonical NTP pyrophosphatase (MazG superfamily)